MLFLILTGYLYQ